MRSSERGSAAGGFLVIVLLMAVVIVYFATRIPQEATEELGDITEDSARDCELKLRLLTRKGREGKDFSADFTSAELNSFITKGYVTDGFEIVKEYTRQGTVSVDDLRISIASDEILLIFKTYVKFKYLYVRLGGRLKTKKGRVVLRVKEVSIGRLPLPSGTASLVAGIVRAGEKPLGVDAADYIKNVEIKGDKLVVTVGK